ncbi:MAG: ribbon-helix-helix protein, CopG family [Acutalibacter sp.]
MTDMRRVTISLPEDIDKRILRLKKTNKFVRESYSEIVRQLLLKGLEKEMKDKAS